MNKILILIFVLLTTFLSYVVYAMSQQANEQKPAKDVIADIFNPQEDELGTLADRSIAEKKLEQASAGQPGNDADIYFQSASTDSKQPRLLRGTVQPPAPMQLNIAPVKDEAEKWNGAIEIQFTNTSEEAVKFLKPLDGSFWGWYQPHYKFTVTDENGEALKLSGRCGVSGLWGGSKFPEDYLIELAPNESHKVTGYLHFVVPESGDHNVSFEYTYDFEADPEQPAKGKSPDDVTQRPVEGVWRGTLESNEITVELKKTQN